MNIFENEERNKEEDGIYFLEEWEDMENKKRQEEEEEETLCQSPINLENDIGFYWNQTTTVPKQQQQQPIQLLQVQEKTKTKEEEGLFEEFMNWEGKNNGGENMGGERKRSSTMLPWNVEEWQNSLGKILIEEEERKKRRKKNQTVPYNTMAMFMTENKQNYAYTPVQSQHRVNQQQQQQKDETALAGSVAYFPNMENLWTPTLTTIQQQLQQQQQLLPSLIRMNHQRTQQQMTNNNNEQQWMMDWTHLQQQQQSSIIPTMQAIKERQETYDFVQHSTPSPRTPNDMVMNRMQPQKIEEPTQVYHPKVEEVTLAPFTTNAQLSLRAACGNLDVRQDKVLKMKVKTNDPKVTFYNWEEHQNEVVKSNRAVYVEFVRVKYRKEDGQQQWKTSSERKDFIRLRQFDQSKDNELTISFKLPRTQLQYCNRTIQNVLCLVMRIHYIPMGYALDQYAQEVNKGQRSNFTDIELQFVCATKKRGRLFDKVPHISSTMHADILKLTHYEQSTSLHFTEGKDLYRSALLNHH